MKRRVLELHRVLQPNGSLYLHCDANASHYLKVMLDSVSDVVALTPEQFRSTPHFDRTFDTSLLTGIGMIEQRLIVLLHMDKVVLGDDIDHALETATATS